MVKIMAAKADKSLFQSTEGKTLAGFAPLAVRMRPKVIGEFVGQEHFAGEGKLLRRMLEGGAISSLIFYGPPGSGKTTLAKVISNHSNINDWSGEELWESLYSAY
jgi:putative ATPase